MTERDSKNKKLTREGTVFRPEDKKKGEMRVWIQKCLDDLRSQTEHFESEILKAKVSHLPVSYPSFHLRLHLSPFSLFSPHFLFSFFV